MSSHDLFAEWYFGVWSWNSGTGASTWNAGMYALLNIPAGTPPEKNSPLDAFVTPQDTAKARTILAEAASGAPCTVARLRLIRPDGAMIYTDAAVRAYRTGPQAALVYYGTLVNITAELDATQTLREEQIRAEMAQEIGHFGYWDWDIPTGNVVWTPEIYRIFGTTPEAFQPHIDRIMERTLPEDRRLANALITESIAQKKAGRYNQRIVRPSGEQRWLDSSFEPIFNDSGVLIRIIGTAQDITERMQNEVALKQERARSIKAQEIARFGYWQWDATTKSMLWSDAVYTITGLPRGSENASPDSLWQYIHLQDRQAAAQTLAKALAGQAQGAFSLRLVNVGAVTRFITSSYDCEYDGQGHLLRILGTLYDITDQKLAELDALRREEQLRVTLQSIGDGVIATDSALRVVRINPAAAFLTGYYEDEALGQPLSTVFHVVSAVTRQPNMPDIDIVLRQGKTSSLENNTLLIARDGRERMVADLISPIVNAEGEIDGVVIILRDISDRLEMEERLRHSQKMESIGILAGSVAHDFNNLLGGIVGAAELIKLRLPEEHAVLPLVNLICSAADTAADLTRKLLDFSRKGKFLSTPFDVHQAIRDALSILERSISPQVAVQCDLAAEHSVMIGDPTQIQNAIMNLGVNADHAMPDGGTLSVSTRNIELTEQDCANNPFPLQPGGYIEVSVRDTGEGIVEDIQSRIFEPFFTTKGIRKGTGLGLAAVYGTVKDHHGSVSLESSPGHGTVFRLLFPNDNSVVFTQRPEDVVIAGKGVIMVIDDDPILNRTAQMLLNDMGYTTLAFESPADALRIVRDLAITIDAVLLDMIMPEMSGTVCYDAICALRPDVPVLLCSGFLQSQSVNDLLARGANGFLKKPYHRAELSCALHKVLHH